MTPGVAAIVLASLASASLAPLHESRRPHRDAAQWLSDRAPPSARVLDTRGWTGLYTGRVTYRFDLARVAMSDPRLAYVVVESSEVDSDGSRATTLRRVLAESASPVAEFGALGAAEGRVRIYRWEPGRFAALLAAGVKAAGGPRSKSSTPGARPPLTVADKEDRR